MQLLGSGNLLGSRFLVLIRGLLLVLLIPLFAPPRTVSAGSTVYPCNNERLGFGVTQGASLASSGLSTLQAGWYVNWGVAPQQAHPAGLDFAQIVRVTDAGYTPTATELRSIVARNRASLWLIGNEPDSPFQDNVQPKNYARRYYDLYNLIKEVDPLARVAIGGVVQATPLRMKWLDAVWSEYQLLYGQVMPVDVWNLHTFVLREARDGFGRQCAPPGSNDIGTWGAYIPPGLSDNCGLWITVDEHDRLDLVKEQVVRFRTWMAGRGQQNKELIVSEYGILFPEELGYDFARVRRFMLSSFDYFMTAKDPLLGYPADENRLVQRWAWYSLDDWSFEGAGTTYSALVASQGYLSALGQEFARYAASQASQCTPYVDLQPVKFTASTLSPIRYGQNSTVRIEVEVPNQGPASAPASQVRLWEGTPGTGTLIATVPLAPVPPRFQSTIKTSFDWTVPAWGLRSLTAELDAAGQVTESREDNNRVTTSINFGTMNLGLGAAGWQLVRGPLRPGEATRVRLQPVPVTMSPPYGTSTGVTLLPPPYRATWYDGDPRSGGTAITSVDLAAPATFESAGSVPAYEWTLNVAGDRTAWLVIQVAGGAPETTDADNRVNVRLPATSDFQVIRMERVGPPWLAPQGGTVDAQLRLRIANAGLLAPASAPEVGFESNAVPGRPIDIKVALADTGDYTDALTWEGLPVGLYPFVARVDPSNVLPESNEGNNTMAGEVLIAGVRNILPAVYR